MRKNLNRQEEKFYHQKKLLQDHKHRNQDLFHKEYNLDLNHDLK